MTENIRALPLSRVPEPTGDPFLDHIEVLILQQLAESIEQNREAPLHQAAGLAQARSAYLAVQGNAEALQMSEGSFEPEHYGRFIAVAMIAIRKLSDRQRSKLRHPTRNRAEAQRVLDGESI